MLICPFYRQQNWDLESAHLDEAIEPEVHGARIWMEEVQCQIQVPSHHMGDPSHPLTPQITLHYFQHHTYK